MRRALPVLLILLLITVATALAAGESVRHAVVRDGSSVVRIIPTSPERANASSVPSASCPPAAAMNERATWRLQQTVGSVLKTVSFADPQNGYAAAELGAVYKTTNGGTSWTRVMNLGFPYYWYGIQAFSSQTVLIVGFQNQSGAGIARWTDNGGSTWTSDIVIDPLNWLLGLKFADALHGIAYGNLGYVYVTQNGGRTAGDWTKVTTDPALGWLAGSFTFRPDGNVNITGIKYCHSTDFGYTWAVQHSADPVFDGGCSFPDLTHGWTGGGQISAPVSGWVHRTTDGGTNWSGRLMQPSYPIRIVQFFDSNFGFAAGGNIYSSAGGIWSTADGGTTWNLDVNTGAEMSAIDAKPVSADSTDVWCVGFLPNFNGVFYKTRVGRRAPAGVDGASPAASLAGRAVPNPFFGRTEIFLPGRTAAVFDLAGRRICSLASIRAGVFGWDGRDGVGHDVATGIYLIRAVDGSGSAARVIKIR